MKLHASITLDRVANAEHRRLVTLDDPGFCTSCGQEQASVSPDARNHECEHCGALSVFGSAELLMML